MTDHEFAVSARAQCSHGHLLDARDCPVCDVDKTQAELLFESAEQELSKAWRRYANARSRVDRWICVCGAACALHEAGAGTIGCLRFRPARPSSGKEPESTNHRYNWDLWQIDRMFLPFPNGLR